MRIAIIGAGVSGLTAAHYLHADHEITIFEAGSHIGGHANTLVVEEDDRSLPIDTGFIVFNDWTYPHFQEMVLPLGVDIHESDMGFSAKSANSNFEWAGNTLSSLIFNRDNWWRLQPYQILLDMLRFNKQAKRYVASNSHKQWTLGEFLAEHNFSQAFTDYYILPMGAAIWSSSPASIREYPAASFLHFFQNHGLLNLFKRPQWKTIVGGSKEYVSRLCQPFRQQIHLNTAVRSVYRTTSGVEIETTSNNNRQYFDHVIFACHSDQALALLQQPTALEQDCLSALTYQLNIATLHSDSSLMPKRKNTWAAWNYYLPEKASDRVQLTYYMNLLQKIDSSKDYFVTLNDNGLIDETHVYARVNYMHPVFNKAAIDAQQLFTQMNQIDNTSYCGAYWRNGFHEDGVWSALQAVSAIQSKYYAAAA